MKKILLILFASTVLTGCNNQILKHINMENSADSSKNPGASNDSIPKVNGIGGIFFFAENPEAVKAW
jgi:uncharacterized lipoprotein YajG